MQTKINNLMTWLAKLVLHNLHLQNEAFSDLASAILLISIKSCLRGEVKKQTRQSMSPNKYSKFSTLTDTQLVEQMKQLKRQVQQLEQENPLMEDIQLKVKTFKDSVIRGDQQLIKNLNKSYQFLFTPSDVQKRKLLNKQNSSEQ